MATSRSVLSRALYGANKVLQQRSFYAYSPEPFHPLPDRKPEWLSPDDAVSHIRSDYNIYLHAVAATPIPLLDAMANFCKDKGLKNIKLHHMHLMGPAPWNSPEFNGIIRSNCFHISPNLRDAIDEGRADYTSVFFSEIPLIFKKRLVELDLALISCSVPDHQGYCSLGTNVDCTRAAIKNAKRIVGVCNPQMPRTFGDGTIHESHFDALVFADFPLPEQSFTEVSPREEKIGELIANNLVADGATLQFGIGNMPQTIMPLLKGHRDLGVHTEQFTDSLIDLIEDSVITNSRKKVFPGKVVGTFCLGTRRLYDYIDDNPLFMFCDVEFNNDQQIIRQNPKVTSINTAIEIDITGQVCADSIGHKFYSGFGGQIDFVRGATLCNDGQGRAIICLTSTTSNGEPKIVPQLKEGAGVVTTRAHVNYVVTEYGIAQLFGKNFRQRAYELIQIAHPDHREILEKEAFERLKVMPSPN